MRHTAGWWAERVAELEASGDARAVARRHRVKERTLLWWRSELVRRAREGARSGERSGARLLPVVVEAAPASAPVGGEIEVFVEFGAARITVRGGVSPEHLTALATAASSRAC